MARTRKKHMYKRHRYRYRGGKPKAKAKKKSMKQDFKNKKANLDKKADALQNKMEKKAGEMGKEALAMAKDGKKKLSAGLDRIQGTLSGKNQQRMQMARDKLKGAMKMMMPIIQRVGKTARPWIKAYMNMIKRMMTMYAAAVGTIASKAMGMAKGMGGPAGMMGKMQGMMGKMPGMKGMMSGLGNVGALGKTFLPGPMGSMMGKMSDMTKGYGNDMSKMMGEAQKALPSTGTTSPTPSAPPASQVDRSGKSFQKVVEEDTISGKKPLLGGVDKTKGDAKKHFATIFGYIKKRFKNKKNYLDKNFRVSWEGKKKNPPLTGPEYVDRGKEYLDPKSKVFNISGDTKMSKTFEKSVNDDILKGKFPLLEGIDIKKKPAKKQAAKILGYIKKRFVNKANYVNENYKVGWEGKKKNPPLTGPEYVDRGKIYLDPKGEIWKITEEDVKAAKAKKGGRKTRKFRRHSHRRTRKSYY